MCWGNGLFILKKVKQSLWHVFGLRTVKQPVTLEWANSDWRLGLIRHWEVLCVYSKLLVLVCLGCPNKIQQTEWVNTNLLSDSFGGFQKSKIKVSMQGCFILKENMSHAPPLVPSVFLAIFAVPWQENPYCVFASIFTWWSPCMHVCIQISPF